MAAAIRPVVGLMLLATVLLVAAGIDDGVVPGGVAWDLVHYRGLGWTPYAFAALNLVAAALVARGSERGLVARIALSGLLVVERPLTAVLLGPKSQLAVALHVAAALVELVILLGGLRVWRLGRAYDADALADLLEVDRRTLPAAAVDVTPSGRAALGPSAAVGLLALLLAGLLVVEGAAAGYVPGGRVWGVTLDTSGWTAYAIAVAVLSLAVRGAGGGRRALRVTFVAALGLFVARAFSPLVLPLAEGPGLVLHAAVAFAALALALACDGALAG